MGVGIYGGMAIIHVRAVQRPVARGPIRGAGGMLVSRSRLPTDAVGTFALTLQNCVVGSTYRVEVQSTGAQVAVGTISASTTVLTLPLYPAGNAANNLRVKLRKASASPTYRPFESVTVASAAGALIYCSQELDE